MDPKLVIAGDSHILSFGIPWKSRDDSHYLHELETAGVAGLVGPWPRQFDDYWNSAQEHAAGRVVAVFWGGNAHLAHFLFAPNPLFDFVPSSHPDLPLNEDVDIVPEELVRTFLRPAVDQLEQRVRLLKSVATEVLVPGTPAPKEDDAFIRMRLGKEPYFIRAAERLGVDVATVPLSPALLRYKLWLVLQDLLREMALTTSAKFVPVPAETQTPDGFLHPSCWLNDITHANLTFGSLLLRALCEFVPQLKQT